MLNRLLALTLVLSVGIGLTSLKAQPYERTVRDTVSLTEGSVSVVNDEGSVTVTTWSRDAVAYEARIVSEQAADYVENTVIDAEKFNQELSLASNFDALEARWSFGPEMFGYGVSHPAVHYTLTVPAAAEVSVEGTDAEIEVTGLRASLRVETNDGPVQVANQRGTTRIDAHEGPVTVTNVRGDLKLDTHEGTATVKGLWGRLLLDTHEGEADVAVDSLGGAEVDTHEGDVTLSVPAGTGFDLSTDLGDGAALQGDFAFDSLRDEEGNYHGTLQGGGPLVHIRSHEGTVTLRQQ